MKKLNAWVRNLSLSQQLFVLVFFFITFFAAFFFVYLTGNIDDFIKDQMFNVIDRNQDTIVNLYEIGIEPEEIVKFQKEDKMMCHVFYTKTGNYTAEYNCINSNQDLIDTISIKLKQQMDTIPSKQHYTYNEGNISTYFAVNIPGPDFAVVSLVTNEYRAVYRDSLLSTVINITVVVVGAFFIVLMVWVGYLIHPLNQIRNYIEKIRVGEDAELKINRNDEIGELADALVSMRLELGKQEKTKEEMIHNISHDLKTPIATIKSYGESIKDGIYPYDTLEKSVDVIIDNAERLEKKVHSLLFLNRIDYLVSQSNDDQETPMKEVVESVILATKVIRNDVEIKVNLDDVNFKGSAEPWRITIENLMENSLRYAKSQIDIHLDSKGFTIANDGPSMSQSRIDALFKPFEKGQGGQFGLGLSIVYKVTQANGYKVSGENTTHGVIFRISKGSTKS